MSPFAFQIGQKVPAHLPTMRYPDHRRVRHRLPGPQWKRTVNVCGGVPGCYIALRERMFKPEEEIRVEIGEPLTEPTTAAPGSDESISSTREIERS